MELIINDMQEGYLDAVHAVSSEGARITVRGMETRELLGATIVLLDPTKALPVGVGRNLNRKIAAVEALQLIGGVLHPELMVKATSNFKRFMDGGTFHGGYGQRIRSQLSAVVKRLQADPTTRQAIITIWDPLWDLFTEGVHDYPCTLSLHFLFREGKLQLHTTMRSNDVWKGLAYDAFMFTQLQLVVAATLGVPPGPYFHHANSLHIYDTDMPRAYEMLANQVSPIPFSLPSLVGPLCPIEDAMQIARLLLRGEVDWRTHERINTVSWYKENLP